MLILKETDQMDNKTQARVSLENVRHKLIDLSHKIHSHPELAFKEEKACEWLTETLAEQGFQVQKGVFDLPTAFIAQYGKGSLNVAFCAEYDALPEVGHACGHNIIGAAAVGAGIAAAKVADELDLTISVIGTPAEEHGGGKVLMLDRGGFKGVHAAMMVHPAPFDLLQPSMIAAADFEVHYTGKEAHASGAPEKGINAADALTVAQTAIGLLRQHISPMDRIHGIITKGGDAPNVIPARTSARYIIRSPSIEELNELRKKVLRCFEAGAIATGSKLKVIETEKPYSQVAHNPDIAAFYKRNAEALGRAFLDDLNESNAKSLSWRVKFFMFLLKRIGFSPKDLKPMLNRFAGSTDMGNVSLVIPSIHPMIGIDAKSSFNHQPEFTVCCAEPSADKAVFDGALAMAWTAIDLATDQNIRNKLLK